jgi:ribosomal protein L18E
MKMSTNQTYKDPNIEKLYNDLLKLNLKTMAPEESSETWEVVKMLYKKERRRRWKITLAQIAIALSASLAIGTLIYKKKKSKKEEHFLGSGI